MAYTSRVLVIASITSASDDLIAALTERAERSPARFELLMPAGGPGFSGREAMVPRLEAALARWREAGLEVTGGVGDMDPVIAVMEAWDPRAYDEVIVSTLPGHASKWMQFDLPHRIARYTDSQVKHVTARDPAAKPRSRPVPVRHGPSGLATVLSWAGRH